jgi:polygalacturonase
MNRHNLNLLTLLSFAFLFQFCQPDLPESFNYQSAKKLEKEAWERLPGILERINPPDFSLSREVVTISGENGDSTKDFREAFNKAISELSGSGGGRLIVPPGQYFIDGPIHLKSNINLHIEEGARIFFSHNPDSYLPAVKVRWEGTVCYNYSPLIYGYQLENVAITGKGIIDGAAKEWSIEWRKHQNPDKTRLRQMGNDTVPEQERVFANGYLDLDGDGRDDGYGDGMQHYLRPTLIELYECEGVLIEDLTLRDSPMWTVHPVFSKNVTLRNLKIYGESLNDDGIDPDSSEDLLIEGCEIRTHDDAISIKAGRDQDAWDRPGSRNIIVRNNHLLSGVNALCIGSEMSGGVENIYIYSNYIAGGKHALNFKCNLDRGGQVQKVYIKDMEIESCQDAIFIFRMDYHGYRGNHFPTKFNDFYVSGIKCKKVEKTPFRIVGVAAEPITRILLDKVTIDEAGEDSVIEFAEELVFNEVIIQESLFQLTNSE